MILLNSVVNYIKDVYTDQLPYFPANIRTSLLIILFCVISTIELYLLIIFRRLRQMGQRSEEQKWKEYISNIIANVVIYDDTDDANEVIEHFYPKLKNIPLKKRIVQKILIEEILTYHRNFIGKPAEIMALLYKELGLDKLSKAKIDDNNWEVKIEGIREANEMGITSVADKIVGYTDDENGFLRMEAQAAYIKLSTEDPFHFLDRARERILDWHQVVLFEVITKNKDLKIPSFSKWLRSSNDTVVMLCLKLIDHFMQFDSAEEIKRLLKHHNPDIVKKSVQIIGKLELSDAEKEMFEVYFDHTEEIKLAILKSFGKISSGNYSDFLSSRIHSSNIKLKREALYAIKRHPENGTRKLEEMYPQTTLDNQALIKHVLDTRIKQ